MPLTPWKLYPGSRRPPGSGDSGSEQHKRPFLHRRQVTPVYRRGLWAFGRRGVAWEETPGDTEGDGDSTGQRSCGPVQGNGSAWVCTQRRQRQRRHVMSALASQPSQLVRVSQPGMCLGWGRCSQDLWPGGHGVSTAGWRQWVSDPQYRTRCPRAQEPRPSPRSEKSTNGGGAAAGGHQGPKSPAAAPVSQ